MDEPQTLTKRVYYGWVESYHRGAGWYALHSAPIIGINQAAQDYWLRQRESSLQAMTNLDGPTTSSATPRTTTAETRHEQHT